MKESLEEVKEKLQILLETLSVIGVSQYILNDEKSKERVDFIHESDEKIKNEKQYNGLIIEYELFRKDIEIINMIYNRMLEVEYDEDDIEKCANAIYSLAGFLSSENLMNEDAWSDIREKAYEILREMKSRDFITTIQLAAMPQNNETMNAIKEKINVMSEPEFLRFYYSCYHYDFECDKELNKIISKRLETISKVLIPKCISLSDNALDVRRMLDNVENAEKVEAIVETLYFWDEGIDEKVKELIEGLSDEQVVRMILRIKNMEYENAVLDNIITERMQRLGKEDIELITVAYLKCANISLRNKVIKIAKEKGVVSTYTNNSVSFVKNFTKDMELFNRMSIYQKYNDTIKNVAVGITNTDLIYALEIYTSVINPSEEDMENFEELIKSTTLELYNKMETMLNISDEVIEYITRLSHIDDKSIVKILNIIKQKTKDEDISIDVNLENEYRLKAYKITEDYLIHRILETKDKEAILLLSSLFSTEDGLFNNIVNEKLDKNIENIKLIIPEDNEK